MSDMINKIAQRRSLFNQFVRSPLSVQKHISKLNPVYQEQYDKLESADMVIREITGPYGETLKELVKDIKENNKAHRWLAVLSKAFSINYLVKGIVTNDAVQDLLRGADDYIREFYFSNEDSKGQSVDLERLQASNEVEALIKEALFGDMGRKFTDKFLSGLTSNKSREIKRLMASLVSGAETLSRRTFKAYDDLDKARANGNIGDYVKVIASLKKEQEKFEVLYKKIYENVKDYIPKQDAPKEPVQEEESKEDIVVQDESVSQPVVEAPASIPVQHYPAAAFPVIPDIEVSKPAYNFPKPPPTPRPSWMTPEEAVAEEKAKQEQLEFEYAQASTLNDKYTIRIKQAIAYGDNGLAAALLSHYSQHLEDVGNIKGSITALAMAEDMLNERQ